MCSQLVISAGNKLKRGGSARDIPVILVSSTTGKVVKPTLAGDATELFHLVVILAYSVSFYQSHAIELDENNYFNNRHKRAPALAEIVLERGKTSNAQKVDQIFGAPKV